MFSLSTDGVKVRGNKADSSSSDEAQTGQGLKTINTCRKISFVMQIGQTGKGLFDLAFLNSAGVMPVVFLKVRAKAESDA